MSDEFDDLKRAFDTATPEPDPQKKSENIERAEEIFARSQGTAEAARQTVQKGRISRLLDGVKPMTTFLTSRAGLAASTALGTVGLVMILPDLPPPSANFGPETAGFDGVVHEAEVLDDTSGQREERAQVSERRDREAPVAPGELAAQSGDRSEADGLMPEPMILAEPAPAIELGLVEESFASETRGRALSDLALAAPAPSVSAKRVAPPADAIVQPERDTEAFASAPENTLKIVTQEPVSTFSIDVDTASYGVVRSSLTAGVLPPREAVRVEELVNYFPYAYPAPDGLHPFEPTISVLTSPWNDGTRLVHIGLQGEMPALQDRPPLNLVFLIDTSGSMQDANKLPLLKQSFRLMLSELRPEDEVSIVTYAGSAGQVLEPTRAG